MARRPCEGITKDGHPCRSFALEAGRCVMHDESRAETIREARSRGVVKASRLRALKGKRRKLDSAAGLIRFVSEVVQDTLAGTIAPDVARAALYGVSIQRQLIETGEIERRLAALEQQVPATGRNRWA